MAGAAGPHYAAGTPIRAHAQNHRGTIGEEAGGDNLKRHDYELLVNVIRPRVPHLKPPPGNDYGEGYCNALQGLIRALADALAAENKAFDRERFITDCGMEAAKE